MKITLTLWKVVAILVCSIPVASFGAQKYIGRIVEKAPDPIAGAIEIRMLGRTGSSIVSSQDTGLYQQWFRLYFGKEITVQQAFACLVTNYYLAQEVASIQNRVDWKKQYAAFLASRLSAIPTLHEYQKQYPDLFKKNMRLMASFILYLSSRFTPVDPPLSALYNIEVQDKLRERLETLESREAYELLDANGEFVGSGANDANQMFNLCFRTLQ